MLFLNITNAIGGRSEIYLVEKLNIEEIKQKNTIYLPFSYIVVVTIKLDDRELKHYKYFTDYDLAEIWYNKYKQYIDRPHDHETIF